MEINTILLVLLVIVNYTNFFLTHKPFRFRKNPRVKKQFLR